MKPHKKSRELIRGQPLKDKMELMVYPYIVALFPPRDASRASHPSAQGHHLSRLPGLLQAWGLWEES